MPARAHLSEEAEQEEADERVKLRALQNKLRDLRDRRQMALAEVRKLTDELEGLLNARHPGEEEVERIHSEYRELGHQLSEARGLREEGRRRLDEALAAVREFRSSLPRQEHARPEQIRKEIRDTERRQQTTALPVKEENALIDHLRRLTKELAEAERDAGVQGERHLKLKELEKNLADRRAEFAKVNATLEKVRADRDARMASIRSRLVEAGRLVAAIREKGKVRSTALDKLRAIDTQGNEVEREVDRLMRNSRDRRQEARAVINEYRRGVRGPMDMEAAVAKQIDEQLEQLLKRGKVVLRG
jgi:uncharacterized coiled-coil DUF342 family protein